MVEPQEDKASAEAKKLLEQVHTQLMETGKRAQQQIVSIAETNLAVFNALKTEIDRDMAAIHDKIEGIKKKIKEHSLTIVNPNGLFRQKDEDYFKCLELNHRQLEQLFRQDAAELTKELREVKSSVRKIDKSLEECLIRQRKEIEAILNPAKPPRFTLRKL